MQYRQAAYLFVGGPWDGRRVALKQRLTIYAVAEMPNSLTHAAPAEGATVYQHREFVYRLFDRAPGPAFYVPHQWFEDEMDACINDLNDRVMGRLQRGYVGDPR